MEPSIIKIPYFSILLKYSLFLHRLISNILFSFLFSYKLSIAITVKKTPVIWVQFKLVYTVESRKPRSQSRTQVHGPTFKKTQVHGYFHRLMRLRLAILQFVCDFSGGKHTGRFFD